MAYIDGFIVPVPKTNIAAYREFATRAGKIWKEYGALEFHECQADDVQPGELTSFPQSVDMKPGETVFFSWIVYESREHRDQVNSQVLKDPRIAESKDMPFDGKRMIFGGFKSVVDL